MCKDIMCVDIRPLHRYTVYRYTGQQASISQPVWPSLFISICFGKETLEKCKKSICVFCGELC